MTDSEMRIRLAEAMGWHNIRTSVSKAYDADGCQYQSCTMRGAAPGARPESNMRVPDPLESDRDAALLREWCLEQGWNVALNCYPEVTVFSVYSAENEFLAQARVCATADLSPVQRERLATSRAVVQAIEATEAQDEP